jgi:hypothetical protein
MEVSPFLPTVESCCALLSAAGHLQSSAEGVTVPLEDHAHSSLLTQADMRTVPPAIHMHT